MRKIILFFIAINFLNYPLLAQNIEWGKTFGGNTFGGNFLNYGRSVDVDYDGNVYITGSFEGTGDFDPGPSVHILTSNSEFDIFISKFDKNGNFIWAKSIGGLSSNVSFPYADIGYGIVVDKYGNVYVCGAFENTADFDPGPGIYNLSSAGHTDIFILKLDTDGNMLWVKNIGESGVDVARSMAIGNGYLYITGQYGGKVDFDPGISIFNLTSNSVNTFILKLDDDGNFIWAKSINGNANYGLAISTDNNGNVLTTGYYRGTVDFDPGIGVFNLSSEAASVYPSNDIFISKLDSNGNFIWAKSIGGIGDDRGYSITTDKTGNSYTTGFFEGIVDFDPGVSIYNLSANTTISISREDIFILKLDANGSFVWARNMGGKEVDEGFSVKVDKYGNVYSTGLYREEGDFDPGPGVYIINGGTIAWLQENIFISKLDVNGDFVWAKSSKNSHGGGSMRGYSIHIDRSQNIYLTGTFSGIKYFEFEHDTINLEVHEGGGQDVFILKLSQCPTTTYIQMVDTCQSYTWIDGNTYTQSGDTATYIIQNAQGCDSIITLDLTIHLPDKDTMEVSTCDSYTWQDSSYTQSGSYTYHTTNIHGCDSTVVLNLTIHESQNTMLQDTVCDSYIWQGDTLYSSGIYSFDTVTQYGCDSTVTLDIVINKPSDSTLQTSACESYIWHDSIYTKSGIYRYDTLNIHGCDSTVTLLLEIVDKIEKLDTMSICQGDTIRVFDEEISAATLVSKAFTSQKGCDSIQNIQVVVEPLPQGTITKSICEGDSIYIIDRWLKAAGIYQIQKSNTQGCDSLYEVIIEQRPVFSTYDTIRICSGDTINVFGFDISEEKDVEQSYVGSNDCDSTVYVHIGVLPVSTSQTQITLCPGDSVNISGQWIKQSGTYQEILTAQNGCDSTVNIAVAALKKPAAPVYEIDCDQGQVLLNTGANPLWQIRWDNGDTTANTIYKNQATVTLQLTTPQGCTEEYTVQLPEVPGPEDLVFPSDTMIDADSVLTVDLNLDGDAGTWSVQWFPGEIVSCDTCLTTTIKPEEDIKIEIDLTHKSGCEYRTSFTITIRQPEIYIPDIYTPNGDGTNDIWSIKTPNSIEILSCKIYDRWGEAVYFTQGNTIAWDGTYRGKKVMQGVYVYVIKYRDEQGKERVVSGDVTVVR